MKLKFTLSVVVATLTFYSATALKADAQTFANTPKTTPEAAYNLSQSPSPLGMREAAGELTVDRSLSSAGTFNSQQPIVKRIPQALVEGESQVVSTVFNCVRQNDSFATIALRGDRTTPPVITWKATLGQYTPQERCNIVSQKLTAAVARNGGKLKNLQLATGAVNNQAVICVVNNVQPFCNRSNTLFTLRPENAKRPEEILARLHNFSVLGDGNPIQS